MASLVSLAPWTEALLAAVPDAVLLCAPDGRVLRGNAAAAELLGTDEAALAGQSVFDVVDEELVRNARDGESVAMRVRERLVGVRKTASPDGFALALHAADVPALRRDIERLAFDLTESVRGPLASIRAAVETMTEYPEMDESVAAQFTTIIREQAVSLSGRLEEAAAALAEATKAERPLEHVRAEVLQVRAVAALREALSVRVDAAEAPALVVRAEWPTLRSGLVHLATRIVHAVRAEALTVRIGRAGQMVALDLCWSGPAVKPDRLARWVEEPLGAGGSAAAASLRDVLERHGSECWARDPDLDGRASVRLLLPTWDALKGEG